MCPCDCSCGSLLICPGHRLEAWPTGEDQGKETPYQNLVTEILRKISEFLKAWASNAVAEVIRAACKDARGLPGLEYAAAVWKWGWLWAALLLPSGASHPESMLHLCCVLKVMVWWLHLPEPTGKLVVT